jgi:hypothetical protein
MKVLGYCIFETIEQRRLAEGAELSLPRSSFLPDVLKDARLGDLIWVKEPWSLISSRRYGPANIREVAVGPVELRNRNLPPRVRAVVNQLRNQPKPAYALARADSRATLEITGIGEETLQVTVHMMQVDQLRRQKSQKPRAA